MTGKPKVKTNCAVCGKELLIYNYAKKEYNYCNKACFHLKHGPKIEHHCDNCGKKLNKSNSKIAKTNFCNRACHREYNKIKTFNHCEKCKGEIKIKTPRKAYGKGFCSQQCVIDYALENYGDDHGLKFNKFNCEQCNKVFYLYDKNQRFCSRLCRGNFHSKDNHYKWLEDRSMLVTTQPERNTKEYKDWRNYILNRDNHKCQVCGTGRDKDILCTHHIKPVSKYKDLITDTENGITLCEHNCHYKTYRCEELFEDLFSEMVDLINRGQLEDKREYYKNVFLTIVQNKQELK
jgi:hypothetical protein